MNINKFYTYINDNYIISEHLRSTELQGYVDQAIDDINERLQSRFPLFADWADYVTEQNAKHLNDPSYVPLDVETYTAIPAQYLRKVVAIGAAINFFTNDEEGEQVASKYYITYERNIMNMVRDYIDLVPEEFCVEEGGYITTTYNSKEDLAHSTEGLVVNYGDFLSY